MIVPRGREIKQIFFVDIEIKQIKMIYVSFYIILTFMALRKLNSQKHVGILEEVGLGEI